MKSDRSIGNPPAFSSGGGEPSCVSMKSDRSIGNPPAFSSGGGEPSCVSIKSDRFIGNPPAFSSGGGEPSCVSMKSDRSIGNPPAFSSGGGEPSCVSVKSDRSIRNPPAFSNRGGEPSCVSMKSDWSIRNPPAFSSGAEPSDQQQHSAEVALKISTLENGTEHLQPDSHQPEDDLLHIIIKRHKTCMKNKYESLFEGIKIDENKTLLNRIYTQLYIIEGESEGVNKQHEVQWMEKTTRKHLQDAPINCLDIFKPLQDLKGGAEKEQKKEGRKEYQGQKVPKLRAVLTKGIAGIGKTVSVQKFILDWAEGKANQDVDFMFVLPFRELNLIKDDQYSLHGLLCGFHPELKVLDQKIYDECKAVFIFDGLDENRIPLNFSKSEKLSEITMTSSVGVLMTNLLKGELLPSALIWITSRPAAANQIPPQYINRVTEIQGFNDPQKEEYFRKRISDEDQAKRIISHIKTVRSLHIMCHIPVFCWISATVLQRIMKVHNKEIPKTLTEMYSHFLLTQTNMKNEKYEGDGKKKRKRKKEKKKKKKKKKSDRDPKKLLESNRTVLLKLSELAFKQLMKGNVMFYKEDLRDSGIDVTEASVYSGIFTEIFREESVIHWRKVYCFVHLSFQEFLAAVYVFHCSESKNKIKKTLDIFKPQHRKWSRNVPLDELLQGAVNKAVQSHSGHLDLFLRFLMGISLESNQKLLHGILTQTQSCSERTIEYIKKLIKRDDATQYQISVDRSISLFLCLSEMKDQTLSRELQQYLKSEKHSKVRLSPGQCSALACMLLISEEVLDVLDLKKYNTSVEGYRRLIPALSVCRKALLAGCNLTSDSCEALCSALKSTNSQLKELDLSNNDLQDSGVELLSAGLKSSHCELQILRLAGCNLTSDSCEALCSALKSTNSQLKELDLSNNDLQDSGVELLCTGLKSSHCELQILRLSHCMVTNKGCSSLASALKSKPSHLRELDLTYNHPGETGVKLLSDLLKDPHFALKKLQVEFGGKIRMKLTPERYACDLTLDPNTAHENLLLSEGNRKVKGYLKLYFHYWELEANRLLSQRYPERFEHWEQVLSVESLTGRCYWEAEWSGWSKVDIAVSYKGISRKGDSDDSQFGFNAQSWSLQHDNNMYYVYHNKKKTASLPHRLHSGRVGVFVDWPAGTLSFYSILPDTHTLTHLHTFTTTFTEPLYAGFRVDVFSSVRVCEIE